MPAFLEGSASIWQIGLGVGSHPSREGSDSPTIEGLIDIDLGAIPGGITATIRAQKKEIWQDLESHEKEDPWLS